MVDKIAIVGAHRASRLLAPFAASSAEWAVWTCSFRNENELPRHDLWFELHPEHQIKADSLVYYEWLKGLPALIMQAALSDFPQAQVYPINRVAAEFGPHFLLNSICHMLALALLERPKVIGLYGVSTSPEYAKYRLGILHFLWIARDRGIEVIVPDICRDILKPPALIPGPVEW